MAIDTKWVRYGENEEYTGYLAKVDRVNENLPAVIVIQEIWGVDSHIQDVTERFARAGYLAFAPDLYARNGVRQEDLSTERIVEARAFMDSLPHSVWNNLEERQKAMNVLPSEKQTRVVKTYESMFGGMNNTEYIDQLLTTAKFLREECSISKGQGVATIGFCMGGALSGLLACRDSELKGAAIFYGNAPSEEEQENIHCPVYGFYGEQDKRISDQVPNFAQQMKAKGKSFNYEIYSDTGHAFFNDTRSSYQVVSARDAYQKVLTFFDQVLSHS